MLGIGAGVWLNVKGSGQFEAAGTPIRPLTASTVLVTDGVFLVSRNPMYLGMVLILMGAALALGGLSGLAPGAAFAWFIDRHFIAAEEEMLAGEFGEAFAAYRKKVRRWL